MVPALESLPRKLHDWRATVIFTLQPRFHLDKALHHGPEQVLQGGGHQVEHQQINLVLHKHPLCARLHLRQKRQEQTQTQVTSPVPCITEESEVANCSSINREMYGTSKGHQARVTHIPVLSDKEKDRSHAGLQVNPLSVCSSHLAFLAHNIVVGNLDGAWKGPGGFCSPLPNALRGA